MSRAISVLMIIIGLLLLLAALYDMASRYATIPPPSPGPLAPATVTVTKYVAKPEETVTVTVTATTTLYGTVYSTTYLPNKTLTYTASTVTVTNTAILSGTVTETITKTITRTVPVTYVTTLTKTVAEKEQIVLQPSRAVLPINASSLAPGEHILTGRVSLRIAGKTYILWANTTLKVIDETAIIQTHLYISPPLEGQLVVENYYPQPAITVFRETPQTNTNTSTYLLEFSYKPGLDPAIQIVLLGLINSQGYEPRKIVVVFSLPERIPEKTRPEVEYWYLDLGFSHTGDFLLADPLVSREGIVYLFYANPSYSNRYFYMSRITVNGSLLDTVQIWLENVLWFEELMRFQGLKQLSLCLFQDFY